MPFEGFNNCRTTEEKHLSHAKETKTPGKPSFLVPNEVCSETLGQSKAVRDGRNPGFGSLMGLGLQLGG